MKFDLYHELSIYINKYVIDELIIEKTKKKRKK